MKTRFRQHFRPARAAAGAVAVALAASACAGAGGSASGDEESITVLMVGNPQMEDIQQLTPEHFTPETGIEVDFTILPENQLRDRVTQDVATQGGQ